MTHDNVMKIATDTYSKCLSLLKTKGHDYASNDEALKNFKESSEFAGIKTIQGNLFTIGVKISRLRELILSDKTPKNESVTDTLDDLINYVLLLKCTYIEENNIDESSIFDMLVGAGVEMYPNVFVNDNGVTIKNANVTSVGTGMTTENDKVLLKD